MNVLLTGATGFVGSYVLRELVARGHRVRCLVREPKKPLAAEGRVEKVQGDVADPVSLRGAADGCDAAVHLVGIIEEKPSHGITFESIHYEGTKAVVREAASSGVRIFVQMSANGARPDGVSPYQTSKWKAEQYVRASGFDRWTIFRPSLIFGDPGPQNPEFAVRLARQLVRPFPVLPVLGDGSFKLRPVSVEEVASAFVQALTLEAASGKTYCIAGEEEITFVEVLDRITEALGKARKKKIPQPLWLLRPVVHTIGRTGLLPITPDQLEMLVEGNTCDPTAFYRDFDVRFRPFAPENLTYLKHRG